MGMFDSFYGKNNDEWQTKALGRSLDRWDIGDPVPVPFDCQMEGIGDGPGWQVGFATIRGGLLIEVPAERDESLPLIPYAGLGAPYMHELGTEMPEACLVCGRTYENAWHYDDHACIDMADIAIASLKHECHEEVSRRGQAEPCELQSVGVRVDPNENSPYPVCKRHVRAPMVPLPTLAEAIMTADSQSTGPGTSDG